jgi:hypothetical protein
MRGLFMSGPGSKAGSNATREVNVVPTTQNAGPIGGTPFASECVEQQSAATAAAPSSAIATAAVSAGVKANVASLGHQPASAPAITFSLMPLGDNPVRMKLTVTDKEIKTGKGIYRRFEFQGDTPPHRIYISPGFWAFSSISKGGSMLMAEGKDSEIESGAKEIVFTVPSEKLTYQNGIPTVSVPDPTAAARALAAHRRMMTETQADIDASIAASRAAYGAKSKGSPVFHAGAAAAAATAAPPTAATAGFFAAAAAIHSPVREESQSPWELIRQHDAAMERRRKSNSICDRLEEAALSCRML